jgi:hypothetical protein
VEFFLEVGGLEADADAVLDLRGLDFGVEAEDADVAAGTGAEAFEDLDRGGLARAVRSEEAEDFAGADFEVDSFDGSEIGIALVESFYLDGMGHGEEISVAYKGEAVTARTRKREQRFLNAEARKGGGNVEKNMRR